MARQLATRLACREVVVVTDDEPPSLTDVWSADALDVESMPVRFLSTTALVEQAWIARAAPCAVVLADLDSLDQHDHTGLGDRPEFARRLRPILAAAPVTVVVSTHRTPDEVERLLEETGERAVRVGRFRHGPGAGATVAVHEGSGGPSEDPGPPPDDFRVTAFVTVYNEDDVLDPVLADLHDQGVDAYVLDNWSTDDSWDIAKAHEGRAVRGLERWPATGPVDEFDLRANLQRIADLSRELDTDWSIKHDADEIRRSPWPGIAMRDALWRVQCGGWNIVDFTVLNYQPVDDGFDRGVELWPYFEHFGFGDKPGHFRQLKAWRAESDDVDYSRFGSHRIAFPGARIFPYKFELHHYPVRSQRHGVRKVLQERLPRYLAEAKQRGWHSHYDHIDENHQFLRDPTSLLHRDDTTWRDHVVELLTGAGLPHDG